MNDEQLLRFSRHLLLDDIDVDGQQKLVEAKVLIIGIGGLGSAAALYLCASGIGQLTLVDHDQVELSNLQRQIIHTQASVGTDKVASAKDRLAQIGNHCQITTINHRLEDDALHAAVAASDVVLDCSDNFTTRLAVNQACVNTSTALVSGAAIQWEGQVAVFDFRSAASACYRCLYGPSQDQQLSCSESGVVSPLVGIIGSVQALETIKLLTGAGQTLINRLLLLDAKYMHWREITLQRDPNCTACGHR